MCGSSKSQNEKADSTLRSSQAVPHPSTNRALRRLTSEVRRDPVYSTRYGRQRWCWAARRLKCRMAAHLPMWECGAQGAGVGASPHATSVCVRGPWLGGALAWRPHLHQSMCLCTHAACVCGGAKAGSTLRSSQAVPHPSTNRALRRLTSEVRRDPVYSTRTRQRAHFLSTGP